MVVRRVFRRLIYVSRAEGASFAFFEVAPEVEELFSEEEERLGVRAEAECVVRQLAWAS